MTGGNSATRPPKSRPPPAPATLHPGHNATSLARSGALQGVPCTGIPKSRHDPRHQTRRLYRSLGGRLETTRAQLDAPHYFFDYKCAGSCIENSRSDRHQNSFGSQSEGLTKIIFRLLQLRASGNHASRTSTRRHLRIQFGGSSDFGFHKPSRFFDLPSAHSESPTIGFGIRSVEVVR